jgi:hypothetical protein
VKELVREFEKHSNSVES